MVEVERGIHPQNVPAEVSLVTPDLSSGQCVTEADPAICVMTDLSVITPFQIESTASLDDVNNKMIACGVRLLFVHDAHEHLIGLITSNDVLGEKPLLFVTNNGGSRDDIVAEDIMTPLSKLEAIPLYQVEKANVADIVAALKDCRRHHMLVLESRDGGSFVRGIYSVTQVGRQLGSVINPSERANSFAQIQRALD